MRSYYIIEGLRKQIVDVRGRLGSGGNDTFFLGEGALVVERGLYPKPRDLRRIAHPIQIRITVCEAIYSLSAGNRIITLIANMVTNFKGVMQVDHGRNRINMTTIEIVLKSYWVDSRNKCITSQSS